MTATGCGTPPVRVLIVPGLHGSGRAHWQTWLQAHWRHALRVRQDDEATPDLARWSRRIGQAIGCRAPGSGPKPEATLMWPTSPRLTKRRLTQALIGRVERSRRPQRAGIVEFQFAV